MTDVIVGRAEVRQPRGLEAATARLRLEHILGRVDLGPLGLAPAAVLCVRRLGDPQPGVLELEAAAVPPRKWARAFAGALERSIREAARPGLGPVPLGANVVLFADRAEMLACLTQDTLDGTVSIRWWWRGIGMGSRDGAGSPIWTAWLREPEHAPAALELLARRDATTMFARGLPPAVAVELAARTAKAFGAAGLGAVIEETVPGLALRPAQVRAEDVEPPWRWLVGEAEEPSLYREQALVIGILLSLRRDPIGARQQAFAASVQRWRAVPPPGRSLGPPPTESPVASPEAWQVDLEPDRRRAGTQSAAFLGRDFSPEPPPADEPGLLPARRASAARPAVRLAFSAGDDRASGPLQARGPRPPADPTASQAGRDLAVIDAALARASQRVGAWHGDDAALAEARGLAMAAREAGREARPGRAQVERHRSQSQLRGAGPAAAGAMQPPQPERSEAEGPPATMSTVETDLGGLFYLLNLALYLDLYADFTRPLDPGIGLDAWEFVELLGAGLLGRRRRDPVWTLLAQLAGRRPGEAMGRGFRPPRAWRVPRAWLGAFDHEGVWRWSAAGGLLRVMHPEGFPVIAVPRSTAAPGAQLRRELERLAPLAPAPVRAALAREPKRPLARWIARLGGYARARLRTALALAPEESLGAVLLEHRARVHVSPSHVDVVLSLAELPLEIRFAGLDRTPGWIPAAGRYLTFHFE